MSEEEHIDFIRSSCSRQLNHLVRTDDSLRGVVNIEVCNDGTYDIILHRGTESEATEIENVNKDELIEMMEEQL